MTAPSKSFTTIADSAIDADSPLTEDLMEDFRDNDICLYEWLGNSYTPAQNHDHDGINSAAIAGASGGLALTVSEFLYRSGNLAGNYGNFAADAHITTPIDVSPELAVFSPTVGDGIIRSLYDGSRTPYSVGESDHAIGWMTFAITPSVGDRALSINFKSAGQMIKVGEYDGDGSADLAIDDVGFQPDVVIIWCSEYVVTVYYPVFCSPSFAAGYSIDSHGNILTDGIISLDAGGFSVGANTKVNVSGYNYTYIALKTGAVNGEKISIDNYTGVSSTGAKEYTDCDFTPDAVIVIPTASGQCPTVVTRIHPKGLTADLTAFGAGQYIKENGAHLSGTDVNNQDDTYDIICIKGGKHVA